MEVPLDGFFGVLILPVAVFQLLVCHGQRLAVGIAEVEVELGVVDIVAQGEDLERLQHGHFGGVSVGLNGSGDKFLDIVPKVAVALVNGQLDYIGRRLGNLVRVEGR